jgi:putative PEP-CTERM system integral membrane protein
MKKQSTLGALRQQIFSRDFWAHLLFWSWNAIFLTFMFLGFAPIMLPEMLTAVESREIPASFLLYALLLTAVPLIMSAIGLYLRTEPFKLIALGYGVEGPLMVMLAMRFFIVRQLTLTMSIILALTAFGLLTLLWQLLDRKIDKRPRWLTAVRLTGLSLLLLIGLYASAWLAFYALPLGTMFLSSLPDMVRDIGWELLNGEWRWVPFAFLFFFTFIYSATLFVLMPIAVPIVYARSWWAGWQTMQVKTSSVWATGLTAVTLIVALTTLALSESHPQHRAFAQLETPPTSLSEARALITVEADLREGLLNAYLAQYRYFSAAGEVDHIRQLYQEAFDLPEEQARGVQQAYELLARPLLYQPVRYAKPNQWGDTWEDSALRREPTEAADLYEAYFDRPITDGERETVLAAVSNTWDIEGARNNMRAIDDREIWLAEQAINISEQGDWADVELYEVYVNQTGQRQEVVYYFSLPEAAVLTGLWLGNSPDKNSAFTHQVAPRGAAQATYRNEVRRNVDPALLEQIGPRQYRLRVFPIEPRQWDWDSNMGRSQLLAAPPLHLWLSYRTMGVNGQWPLPQLAEKRNVFWDDNTERALNGLTWDRNDDEWLPTAVSSHVCHRTTSAPR